jgi:hypothetical protein
MIDRRCWRYRLVEGSVDSRIFDSPDDVPAGEGWQDTPARLLDLGQAEPAEAPAESEPAKKRGRPKAK